MTATVVPFPVEIARPGLPRRVVSRDGRLTAELAHLDDIRPPAEPGPYPEHGPGWYLIVKDRDGEILAYCGTAARFAEFFPPGSARRAD